MKSESYVIKDNLYVRINKVQAKKLHNQGDNIYLLPSNINPLSPWAHFGCIMPGKDFDTESNAYCYYNCNTELGKTVKYFKCVWAGL